MKEVRTVFLMRKSESEILNVLYWVYIPGHMCYKFDLQVTRRNDKLKFRYK